MKCVFKVKIAFAVFVFFASIHGIVLTNVHAQHTDVFNLYQDKGPQQNDIAKDVKPDAPEVEWIEVENHFKYKVSVERSKYEAQNLAMADIELWEIVDKSPFEWHQVDYYLEGDIEEIHTRNFGKQKCFRVRKGSLFWLKDGKKCVYWTKWSTWDCRPEEERDITVYP